MTDDEAMERQRLEIRAKQLADDPDADSDDSEAAYVPSLIARGSPDLKIKPVKITKKVRVKKKKAISNKKKPPR